MAKTTCHRCEQTKTDRGMMTNPDDRHYGLCRACARALAKIRERGIKGRHTATHRTCYLCRRHLPLEGFTQRANETYFSACRQCNRFCLSARRRAAAAR